MPAARRLFYALELLSTPTLLEPIFSCDITAPSECMGGVYQSLNQRRGMVIEEIQIAGTPLNLVFFYLFRLKLIFLSLNHSDSPECLEEILKEKLSLRTSLTIGNSSRDFLLLTRKPKTLSLVSEREKDSRYKSPKFLTTPTNFDVHNVIIISISIFKLIRCLTLPSPHSLFQVRELRGKATHQYQLEIKPKCLFPILISQDCHIIMSQST